MKQEVREKTEKLQAYLYKLKEIYEQSEKPDHNNKVFFEKVRSEILPYYDLLDEWDEQTKELIKQGEVKLHPQQVDATSKSLRALALHSYYIDIRKKRYMNIKKSIDYVFQLLLKELVR